MTSQNMKLSLGPILFFWPKETLIDFFFFFLDAPLDTVYHGEVVCSRGQKLKRLRKIAGQGKFKIEANDMGAVKLAREHGIPFVAGATLNIYNEATLDVFRQLGAYRWIPPAELSRDKIAIITAAADGIETELFAWGKIPLAYSSRCFTARHYNLNKDSCEFRCLDHEHGMTMNTREGQPFLTVNGIQTMSYGCQSLLAHHQDAADIGISMLRLSPQLTDMPRIIELHRAVLNGQTDSATALDELKRLATGTLVDGYWHGQPGIETLKEELYATA